MHWKSNYIYTIGLIAFLCLCPQTMWIETLYQLWSPLTAMCILEEKYVWEKPVEMVMLDFAEAQMPIYRYSMSYYGNEVIKEPDREYENEMPEISEPSDGKKESEKIMDEEKKEMAVQEQTESEKLLPDISATETDTGIRLNEEDSGFYVTDGNIQKSISYSTQLLRTQKVKDIDLRQYYDEEKLVEDFYTIDASTGLEQPLSLEELLGKDMTIQKSESEPQI